MGRRGIMVALSLTFVFAGSILILLNKKKSLSLAESLAPPSLKQPTSQVLIPSPKQPTPPVLVGWVWSNTELPPLSVEEVKERLLRDAKQMDHDDFEVIKSKEKGYPDNPRFHILYYKRDDSFTISISDKPLAKVRREAEEAFLKKAGGKRALKALCQLKVLVGAPYWIEEWAGEKLGNPDRLEICLSPNLSSEEKGSLIIPLLAYENEKYRSFAEEGLKRKFDDTKDFLHPKEAEKIKRLFQKKKFYLYDGGLLVGEFKVTDDDWEVTETDQLCLIGRISWKIPQSKRKEIGELIALSQPIPQPSWSAGTLTEEQSQALKAVIERAFDRLFQRFKLNPKHFPKISGQEFFGVMDLDKDGRKEVDVWARREGKEGSNIGICQLLSWQNNQWVSLLEGYYQDMGEEIKAEGEGYFEIKIIDTNGDGIAEAIVTKRISLCRNDYYFYQLKEGKLVKSLYLGSSFMD